MAQMSDLPPPCTDPEGSAGALVSDSLVAEMNLAIERLDGVQRARVMTRDNRIDEIHVMASAAYKPKTMVRNIETLLLVQFGVRIDHRCISIVQIKEKRTARHPRPVIHSVARAREAGRRVVTIELQAGDQRVRGTSKLDETSSELESGSVALLRAVEQLISRKAALELREVGGVNLYGKNLIFVVLTWRHADAEETLVGAALAGSDPITSAARATLDALNRKLAHLSETGNA